MKLQSDFVNEITLLQHHGIKMGVTINRSPKCHPEIAGEGIEYDWGLSKLHYCRNPLKHKRNKEKFHSLVKESTNPNTVLNMHHVRSCSKKARAYMKLYKSIKNLTKQDNQEDKDKLKNYAINEQTMKLYLRLKKKGKTHRSVIDRHLKDVQAVEREEPLPNKPTNDKRDNKDTIIKLLVQRMNSM